MLFFSRITPRPFVRFLGKERVTVLSRKTALFLAILTTIMLAGCGSGDGGTVIETEQTTTVSEITTTASENEITTAATTAFEEKTTVTLTEEPIEEPHDGSERPTVVPISERYDSYPLCTVGRVSLNSDIKWISEYTEEVFTDESGLDITAYNAEYPVFTGGDEAVCEKINQYLKDYADEAYEYEKAEAERMCYNSDGEYDEETAEFYEHTVTRNMREISFDVDSVSGNILSLTVYDFSYSAGAAHGYTLPVPMMFDLRTGELIRLSEMIADKDAVAEKYMARIYDSMFITRVLYNDTELSEYASFVETMKNADNSYMDTIECGIDENGDYIIGYCVADKRFNLKDGSVGFYIAPYEYGSYADGIRLMEVPIDELLPHLNDEGKALFEGIASSEYTSIDIISYKGEEYLSIMDSIPTDALTKKELTDGDYEFISLFPMASYLSLYDYSNIDFAKLASLGNITRLGVDCCEISDISPLYGSAITYISDYGQIIPKEQADEFAAQGGRIVPERE